VLADQRPELARDLHQLVLGSKSHLTLLSFTRLSARSRRSRSP
jgi:hypothetical protein